MTRQRVINALVTTLAILLMAAPALAQGAKTFAVLPFTYNGPQKYEYFSKALQASLDSDLEWLGQVEPTTKSLEGIAIPTDKGGALNSLRSLGVDYLVYGDIAVLGKKAHVKIETVSQDGNSWLKKGEMPIDEITSWLDAQGKAIQGDAFNRPGYGTAETAVVQENKKVITKAPTNSPFITADGEQYRTDTLNPQFRYEGGTETEGRWRSQTLPFFSYGMSIADGDADGRNEVFILQESAISAYRVKDDKLQHLTTFEMPANTMNIRLEIADLNRDGMPEFIIGGYQFESQGGLRAPRGTPRSSILSFDGGKFKYIVKSYDKFLGLLRIPPTFMPILVAQNKGQRNLFDKHVMEAFIKGDDVHLGQEIKLPPFGNVYNTIYLPDGLGYNYVVISDKHKLVTYSQSFERLNETDQTFNSSGIAIETADKMIGMGGGPTEEHGITYNIPFRMITAPLSSTTKYELLVNKDVSAAAQVFQNYKYYTQGEIHSLVFDQVGMNLAWKTRRIKGQVSDIALADLNNDGNKQLCVLVNTFTGVGYGNRKTVLLAYALNLE
ncbi:MULTISPECIES: VCBS repeat-containing protein [unclassified Pseudodesulfovibrio]|uniref:FG-GAP repeat domain-containing protein n=1 Tax=unclassified Pseudodesulfovibrio TaxID=2661612 RepID=UPI000FEB7EA3|nr:MULTISPECIES: VCBS repeat-containing protein [unclassified Pseudodesulfovibrio]MCJ2164361.1 VCBS repeat-containing protein [Pseudodesulfovibrio sp. S3-i]RWU04570.1 VCBS repeat-containing protein [Pseudodesulfovibrio sp. S3]